ncbi:MAG TPA: hypothetical protein VIY29_09635 [Ktedonobacteraceae bacterium]
MIEKFTLPNMVMKDQDGTVYEPPEWFMKDVLPKIMDLPKDEYIQLRMWLTPIHWFITACQVAQNPLLSKLYESHIMEDRYAYLARYTPPPGVKKH